MDTIYEMLDVIVTFLEKEQCEHQEGEQGDDEKKHRLLALQQVPIEQVYGLRLRQLGFFGFCQNLAFQAWRINVDRSEFILRKDELVSAQEKEHIEPKEHRNGLDVAIYPTADKLSGQVTGLEKEQRQILEKLEVEMREILECPHDQLLDAPVFQSEFLLAARTAVFTFHRLAAIGTGGFHWIISELLLLIFGKYSINADAAIVVKRIVCLD